MTTPDDLVRILQDLPARYPSIIALTWKLMGTDGEIDPDKAILHAKEISAAVEEVGALKGEAHRLLEALIRCSQDLDR